MDPQIILPYDLETLGLQLFQSAIPSAGLGVFTSKISVSCKLIGHYYGSLVYENLAVGSNNSPSVYGELMIAVPVSNFSKSALQLKFETPYGLSIWIYSPPF